MKRFRFPLRPVAILRAHHEMRAREAFAASVHAFVKSEQELAAAQARVRQFELELTERRPNRFSPADQARALTAYRQECTAEVEARQAMAAAQHAMQERRAEYVEAHRKLEVVRRLEEKARNAYRYETAREEQAEFDDFAARRFIRRTLESA
ncbi:MAG TPA: flagellar export protein FliJ [Opitutaceae bacterium]|nr:flagellar export protein FliJ [Opitutaceae bacterium]